MPHWNLVFIQLGLTDSNITTHGLICIKVNSYAKTQSLQMKGENMQKSSANMQIRSVYMQNRSANMQIKSVNMQIRGVNISRFNHILFQTEVNVYMLICLYLAATLGLRHESYANCPPVIRCCSTVTAKCLSPGIIRSIDIYHRKLADINQVQATESAKFNCISFLCFLPFSI